MRASEDRFIDLAREAYLRGLPAPAAGCPPDETLTALVLGELGRDERVSTADHLVGCRVCAASYRSLLALDREARRDRAAHGQNPRLLLALAAMLVAALGVAGIWQARQTPEGRSEVVRSVLAGGSAPVDGARLAAPPKRFSWPPQDGAVSYRFELFDARARVLWRAPPSETVEVSLPQEIARDLGPGGYLWVVYVEGAAVQRLGPSWFEIVDR